MKSDKSKKVEPKKPFTKLLKEQYNFEYGTGEIKTFSPQIKEAIRATVGINLKSELAIKKLRKLGFKTAKSSGIAFIGKTQVFKLMYETSAGRSIPPDKKIRVPTVFLTTAGYYKIVVQPKVEIPRSERSRIKNHHKFRDSVQFPARMHYDVHSCNIGKYRNKLVLFDW